MTERTCLKLALFVPGAVALVFALLPDEPTLVGLVRLFAVGSMLFAGVPYVLTIFGLLLWARGRSTAEMRIRWLFTPLVFAGFVVIDALLVPAGRALPGVPYGGPDGAIILGLLALIVSGTYGISILGLVHVLCELDWVHPADDSVGA